MRIEVDIRKTLRSGSQAFRLDVAFVCEDDLNVMIRRLATGDETERNLAADFVQLRRAAFPPNKEIRATDQMPTKSK